MTCVSALLFRFPLNPLAHLQEPEGCFYHPDAGEPATWCKQELRWEGRSWSPRTFLTWFCLDFQSQLRTDLSATRSKAQSAPSQLKTEFV